MVAVYGVALAVLLTVTVALVCAAVVWGRRKRSHHYHTAPTSNKTARKSPRELLYTLYGDLCSTLAYMDHS